MPVADDEEAIRLMNDSRYGLTASIWTRTGRRAAHRRARRDRHLVHEPLRLPRSGAGLDRRQGLRPRLHAVEAGHRGLHPAEVIPPASSRPSGRAEYEAGSLTMRRPRSIAPAAPSRIRARAVESGASTLDVAQLRTAPLTLGSAEARSCFFVLLHALEVGQRRAVGAIAASALEAGEKRGSILLRTDTVVGRDW